MMQVDGKAFSVWAHYSQMYEYNDYLCNLFISKSWPTHTKIAPNGKISTTTFKHQVRVRFQISHRIHYSDVIMSAMAFRIASLTIVYSTVYSKHRITGLCEGNSSMIGEFPAHSASNADNVSICWRHHDPESIYFIIMVKLYHLTK